MAIEKIKRIFAAICIIWLLFGSFLYVLFGNRDLFEYITLLMFGIYISFDIKHSAKYLLIGLLAWNVIEETTLIIGNDWINLDYIINFVRITIASITIITIGIITKIKYNEKII